MKKEDLGLLILRIGLGGVFLWFGIDKFFNPLIWSKWVPEWFSVLLPIDLFTFVYILGVVETIIGLLVLIGFYTKTATALAGVLLMAIMPSLGFNDIMIRDAGLLFMAIGLMLLGPGDMSLDRKFRKLQKLKEVAKSYKR